MSGAGATPADAIQAAGTPEAQWAAWSGLDRLDLFDLFGLFDPDGLRRVLVVAAHPDDEVLGVGGTIALLVATGARLRLVAVTDGEASHPGSSSPVARDLARVRRAETRAALDALGAPNTEIVRLGLPDTGVGLDESALMRRLAELMEGFDVCLAPWSGDVHADHEATGRATVAAGLLTGVPVLQYPVWTWHWSRPGDPRVPWRRAARIPLASGARARKRAALGCFASQLLPIGAEAADAAVLPPEEIAHFLRDHEVVFR